MDSMMGASEDRATRADQERQIAAFEVEEIGVEGHGLWSKAALKELLRERDEALAGWKKLLDRMAENA